MEPEAVSRRVLVIGSGEAVDQTIKELAALGLEPVRLICETSSEKALSMTEGETGPVASYFAAVTEMQGQPGRYRMQIMDKGRSIRLDVGAVIIATGCGLREPFSAWGIAPREDVLSLSSIESKFDSYFEKGLLDKPPACVLFVCGFRAPSHPLLLEKAVQQAIRMRALGAEEVFLAADHLKVASRGLERLLGRARDEGVMVLRSSSRRPEIMRDGQTLRAECLDEALGEVVSLRPELIVLEDILVPWGGTGDLSRAIGIGVDGAGFFQSDCVHELPIFTNRTGVFVVGSAKGPVSREKALEEAAAAAVEAARILLESDGPDAETQKVELDKKKCAICLTCYRVCPHRAISYLNRRPVFHPLACRGCGICAAECPMDAIQLTGSSDRQIKERIREALAGDGAVQTGYGPLVVFACRRSGIEAAGRAVSAQPPVSLTLRLIEVPCAGRLDPDHLLTAFRYGAGGVMVMACHHGSCRSLEGSLFAEGRSAFVMETLREMGVGDERLCFCTIAPMEAGAFSRMVQSFEKRLREALVGDTKVA